ncbi:hypothetical protein ACQKP0_11215 [Heyndrickxia sp. NPDC080065]|uniref:hypothetical protein n=1 Tax=Heyndrickxia sp. NPDC080065 TaxID=3390568 RepID=UPI003D01AB3E
MNFEPTKINIVNADINSAEHIGSISFGSTVKVGRNVFAKKNQPFGQQLGDTTVLVAPVGVTYDDEILDHSIIKTNI